MLRSGRTPRIRITTAQAASVSADNEFSVAETQRLQGTAQRLIEDNRVVVIGSEP
jgi:hypothetical protein